MKVICAPDFALPELSPEETQELREACLADPEHKLMPPVQIWDCGKQWIILDGTNQHRIREANSLKIRYRKMEFETRQEARAHAITAQLSRRNLDRGQYAYWLAERDKERRQSGSGRPENRKSVNGKEINAAKFAVLSELADEAGVSERTMRQAAKVADNGASPIKKAVANGRVSVSDAAAVATLPKKEQAKIAAKAKREGTTLRQAAKKPGQVKSDVRLWDRFDDCYAKLIRLVDDLHRNFPDKKQHDSAIEHLAMTYKAIKAWKMAPTN